MNVIDSIKNYTDAEMMKAGITTALSEVKKYTDRAIKTIRAMSKIDTYILGAVCACAGAIIGCVLSKSIKKILVILAMVCGLGSAYLLYKKYFKD